MRLFATPRLFQSIMSAVILCSVMATPGWSVPVPVQTNTSEVVELLKKAYSELGSGSVDQAVGTLCAVIKLDRNSAMGRRYLCYALLQRGEAREAIAQLDALAQLNCGIPFDLCMRGQALQLMGEYRKATEALKAAVGLDPTSDYIRDKLIDSLQMSGDYKEASAECADGYYAAQDKKLQNHYLEVYNQIQQARAWVVGQTTPTIPAVEPSLEDTQTVYSYGPMITAPTVTKSSQ